LLENSALFSEWSTAMPPKNTPDDGDFAGYLDGLPQRPAGAGAALPAEAQAEPSQPTDRQTIQDVMVEGQEPTDEFIEEFKALNDLPPLSDEEFERQALEAGGYYGDAGTPE
jgi:hypothetical protein